MSRSDSIAEAIGRAEPFTPEPPRPLARDLPPASPFPTDALGPLAAAATAIEDMTQAPAAICGSSVLAVSSLAAQAHADVVLLTGQRKPTSLFLLSVAASGERKTSVDGYALRPVREREAKLADEHASERLSHENASAAWEEARKRTLADNKREGADAIRKALDGLGPPPAPPLTPMLTCQEPTMEGLFRLQAGGHPSLGIFTAEGGQFLGGHAMSDDARLRTAAGLNALWDGEPLRRVRASDNAIELRGRRVALHLMVQPDVAQEFTANPLFADTGLLGRMLVTAPDTTAGTRMWREPHPDSEAVIGAYGARLRSLLDRAPPLAAGTRNVLTPRSITIAADARRLLIAFHDNIEMQMAPGGGLEGIRPFAGKATEHVARVAGVLTLVADPDAVEVPLEHLAAAIRIVEHFTTEALRLVARAGLNCDIRLAQRTVQWLLNTWPHPFVSLPDLYQRGPSAIREKATAKRLVGILADHGYLIEVPGGAEIDGVKRRDAWRIVR